MGKPPCRDATPPLRPLPSLSSLRPLSSLPSLRSLPAPARTLRQRYRRGQLLAVGANAMGLAQSVGLLLSNGRRIANFMARYRGSNGHYSHVECAYAELERYLVLNCN